MPYPPVYTIAAPLVPADTTPTYTAQIVDQNGNLVPGSDLTTLTLTIADTLSGIVINSCQQVNILNIGRGTVDQNGNLTVILETGDTDMSEVPGSPQVQRSLVFDFTYNGGASVGRHQANFFVVQLAGL